MKKADLVALVARETHLTKREAERVLETVFEVIARDVARTGQKLTWPRFGTFYLKHTRGRRIASPPGSQCEGELMHLGARQMLGFRASKYQRGPA